MTKMIRTKLLAILAVTALALVPAFALIDSSNSSASGTHDVEVKNWEQFKAAMDDARAAPEDTFNITVEAKGFFVEGSITMPANTNTVFKEGAMMAFDEPENKTVVINEGNITLNKLETRSMYSYGGVIAGNGANVVFINKGSIEIQEYAGIEFYDATFVNYGEIVNRSRTFRFWDACTFTNEGTITLDGDNHEFVIRGESNDYARFLNTGRINGSGELCILEYVEAYNIGGTITCPHVHDSIIQGTTAYDSNKAGKTISSEGFDLNLNRDQINNALRLLGDVNMQSLIEDAVIASLSNGSEADIVSLEANLALKSYFCEAEYPYNMTLKTAVFDVTLTMNMRMEIVTTLPAEGTYDFGTTPPMESKRLTLDSAITVSGLLRIDAYFDAGENLQRVNIGFGLGIRTDATTDLQFTTEDNTYSVSYSPTKYQVASSINIGVSLDFNGFDLTAHNPGDKWDVRGEIRIAEIYGDMWIKANYYTACLLDYVYHDNASEATKDALDDLKGRMVTTVDFDELFDTLFGPTGGAIGIPAASSGAAMAPVNASAAAPALNGLFGNTFLFSAKASMGDDRNVTLTRGDSSSGAIDIGDLLFASLEAEGEDSFVMSSEVDGDSMESLLAGAVVLFTGLGTQEQAEEALRNAGANYSPSNITMKDVNRMCDQKMSYINKMVGRDNGNNTVLYVVIGLISALAVIIAIPMFIRKK